MQVINGADGRTGNPTCVRSKDLCIPRIKGNGLLRIRDGQFLKWKRLSGGFSDSASVNEAVQRLISPRKGEFPVGVLGDSPAIHTESDSVSREDGPDRLTGPIQFVLKLLEYWHLQTQEAVGLLGFGLAEIDYVTAVLEGKRKLRGRDVRDRIANLIRIRMTLWSLFRDLETENDWLREPHPMLENRSPMSLLIGGSMEDLLLTREYVEFAAGR